MAIACEGTWKKAVEEQEFTWAVPLMTKIIPRSSGRNVCTALAPLCPRQDLVPYKQLADAHAELQNNEEGRLNHSVMSI